MLFRNILVAVDGSESSRIASDYAFWLAAKLKSNLYAQYVADPHLADIVSSTEFAEELSMQFSTENPAKAMRAMKRVGLIILNLFKRQSLEQRIEGVQTCIDVGRPIDKILKRASGADLLIVGHHGRGQSRVASHQSTGSVAQKISSEAKKTLLITMQPAESLNQILVGYDGSQYSKKALVLAERLAVAMGLDLKVMHVVPAKKDIAAGKVIMQSAATFLRHYATQYQKAIVAAKGHSAAAKQKFLEQVVFIVREGKPAATLVDYAKQTNSLLVVGAHGAHFHPEDSLGKTATAIVRDMQTSAIIYR